MGGGVGGREAGRVAEWAGGRDEGREGAREGWREGRQEVGKRTRQWPKRVQWWPHVGHSLRFEFCARLFLFCNQAGWVRGHGSLAKADGEGQ